jgi:TRAP transporter TAXI family solute receptor
MGEGASLLKDRHVIGVTATTFSPAATWQELALLTPIKILPISDEAYEELLKINKGYVRAEIVAGSYKGQDESIPTVSTETILIVNSNMPEDEVYWITKIIGENVEGLREVRSDMKNLTVEKLAKVEGIELHPGARKCYEEKFEINFD